MRHAVLTWTEMWYWPWAPSRRMKLSVSCNIVQSTHLSTKPLQNPCSSQELQEQRTFAYWKVMEGRRMNARKSKYLGSSPVWISVSKFASVTIMIVSFPICRTVLYGCCEGLGIIELALNRMQDLDLGLGSTCPGQMYCCHCIHFITVNTSVCNKSY